MTSVDALGTPGQECAGVMSRVGRCLRELFPRSGSLGWIGVGIPEELGGSGAGAVERYILLDELPRASAGVLAILAERHNEAPVFGMRELIGLPGPTQQCSGRAFAA